MAVGGEWLEAWERKIAAGIDVGWLPAGPVFSVVDRVMWVWRRMVEGGEGEGLSPG